MCARYTFTREEMEFVSRFAGALVRLFFAPRFNIAPSQRASVVLVENGKLVQRDMRFGFKPVWAKTLLINAQAETLAKKPTFKKALETQRCLIPADGFYEWKQTGTVKQPMRIMFKSGEPFCFAGLWHREIKPPEPEETVVNDIDEEPPASRVVDSFVIITTAANDFMRPIHHRMPFIVSPTHYDWWMDVRPQNSLHKSVLESPAQEELSAYAVSTRVNNVRNDDVDCTKPA